jgi:hypothetical protein
VSRTTAGGGIPAPIPVRAQATVLMLDNFALITGTGAAVVNLLPWLIAVAVLGGIGTGRWLRAARPGRCAALAGHSRPHPERPPTVFDDVASGRPAAPRPPSGVGRSS